MPEEKRYHGRNGPQHARRPFPGGRSGPHRTHRDDHPVAGGSASGATGSSARDPREGGLAHAHGPTRDGRGGPHAAGRGRGGRPHRARSPEKRLVHHRASVEESEIIPPIGDAIRIIHLGGVEEVGRNMSLVEYKDDIIVIDLGFQFKEEHAPGIDYILPNTKYLEDRKDKIRAVVVTHGHLDHIGGAPYILGKIGNPKIYARLLTTLMIAKRQEEFPGEPNPNMEVVEKDATIKISENISLRFFAVTHTSLTPGRS